MPRQEDGDAQRALEVMRRGCKKGGEYAPMCQFPSSAQAAGIRPQSAFTQVNGKIGHQTCSTHTSYSLRSAFGTLSAWCPRSWTLLCTSHSQAVRELCLQRAAIEFEVDALSQLPHQAAVAFDAGCSTARGVDATAQGLALRPCRSKLAVERRPLQEDLSRHAEPSFRYTHAEQDS